jgi:hypothetical protein
MRRLLYLALALVLLALTGLVFVRVTNSGPYAAHTRRALILERMPREEVNELMTDLIGGSYAHRGAWVDYWSVGGSCWVVVEYDLDSCVKNATICRPIDLVEDCMDWLYRKTH